MQIAELHSLEMECSLPGELTPTHTASNKSFSPKAQFRYRSFLTNIDDVKFVEQELDPFDNEFLEDFSAIAADEPNVIENCTLPILEDNGELSRDATLSSNPPSDANCNGVENKFPSASQSSQLSKHLDGSSTHGLQNSDFLDKTEHFVLVVRLELHSKR